MKRGVRFRLRDRARRVRMFIFDVDGVMTDGHVVLDEHGEEMKFFHVHDGVGINIAHRVGLRTAIITQRLCGATIKRAGELGIKDVYGAEGDKEVLYDRLLRKRGLRDDQVAYMGDDLPDLAILRRAGLAVCPANARIEVKRCCDLITATRGGEGAVREAVERLLKLRKARPVGRKVLGGAAATVFLLALLAGRAAAREEIKGFTHRDFEEGRLVREVTGETAEWVDEKTVLVRKLKVRDYTVQGTWELEADEGKVNTKSWDADCKGNVRLSSSSGEMIQADELVWKGSQRRMIAKRNVHALIRAGRVSLERGAGGKE